MTSVLVALLFAPAPFLKKPTPALSVAALQGKWRRTTQVMQRGRWAEIPSRGIRGEITHAGIEGNQWQFLPGGGKLLLSIDATKTPAYFTYHALGTPDKPYGVGLIRRQGDTVQILYTWGGEEKRPKSFEAAPEGYWLSTLKREDSR